MGACRNDRSSTSPCLAPFCCHAVSLPEIQDGEPLPFVEMANALGQSANFPNKRIIDRRTGVAKPGRNSGHQGIPRLRVGIA